MYADQLSPAAQLRGLAAKIIREEHQVRMPDVTERLTNLVLSQWPSDRLREFVRLGVYDQVRRAVQQTRGAVQVGDEIVHPPKSRWEEWREHVDGQHLRLWDMTKPDLEKASEERRDRAAGELSIADFLDALASRMGDGETVGVHFTVDEIDGIYNGSENGKENQWNQASSTAA